MLSLTQIFALAIRANATARHLTVAAVLAAHKVEELRSTPWRVPDEGVDRVEAFTRQWSVRAARRQSGAHGDHRGERHAGRGASGHTAGEGRAVSLVEVLVATALTMSVMAGVLAALGPAQAAFVSQSDAADARQRMRVAVDAIRRDLLAGTEALPFAGGILIVSASGQPDLLHTGRHAPSR